MGRSKLAMGLLGFSLVASGCFDGASRYAQYQDKKAAIRKIDALVATIPQYPGARQTASQSPYGFGCTRQGAVVSAYIADHGHYELDVKRTTRDRRSRPCRATEQTAGTSRSPSPR
jgi:hypothetical protein